MQLFYISSWIFLCFFFFFAIFRCYLHSPFPYTHPDLYICLCLKRLNNDRIIWLQAKCKLFTNLVTEWQWMELDLYFFLNQRREGNFSKHWCWFSEPRVDSNLHTELSKWPANVEQGQCMALNKLLAINRGCAMPLFLGT